MSKTAAKSDIKKLSFEASLQELEQIVRRLESGEASLEQSIEEYERGSLLRSHCEKKLQDARLKVEKIVNQSGSSDNPDTEPFDIA